MSATAEFRRAFEQAQALQAEGRWAEAEQAFRRLPARGEQREAVLRALADLYWQSRRPLEAVDALVALTKEVPDRLYYYARLAAVLDGMDRTEAAIGHYQRLIKRQPALAAAHFNIALLYKKTGNHTAALAAYKEAVRLGIDRVHEVFSNLGVLYSELRDAAKARQMYERALDIDPTYIPALFNLAGLCEEAGERAPAIDLYRRILAINPRHWDSLARLAHAQRVTSADDQLIKALETATQRATDDRLAREGLYFALGKALDDVARYEAAFAAYGAGNALGKLRNPPYDRGAVERGFDELISVFDSDWVRNAATGSKAAPIFICGMFRSGSTLLEQILAAHPAVTAGGEMDLLPRLVAKQLAPYPQRVKSASPAELQQLADGYLSRLRELFPDREHVTDKRPDDFLHLGLIKVLFPCARIVYTRRNSLDNCLSIYFQQLGGNLNYATDLENTAHYYGQHERLMAHWMACFGSNIFTVDYDELVRSPEPVLHRLLEFLGLPWSDRCLDFQHTASLVKTASVWQVREELHARSSGRWRNYEPFVRNLRALLQSGSG